MIKAVLLDLDNTLLHNPDTAFAHAFLKIFEDYFVAHGFEHPAKNLRAAIKQMSDRQTGNVSNRDILLNHLGGEQDKTSAVLDTFFDEDFPKLQSCIAPVEGAVSLIEHLRERGLAVVIATNPIYPHSAIIQRMQWANLPVDDDYTFITSADNMHFAKPDPAYYAEILARVGIEPDEAIMVGDSKRNDIIPARQLGLHTYHTKDNQLSALLNHIDDLQEQSAPVNLRSEMIEPQLRGNIGALYGLLQTVTDAAFWHKRPDPAEWSIVQIICHLYAFEASNERYRLERILQNENPFITQPKEPGPDIPECADEGYSVAEAFVQDRQETIKLIGSLSDADWQRPARHSIFGLTTLLEMAYFTAQHDRLHLNQLCQTIGKCD